MICPNCGHEMNDDMLYCEKCGVEIQFVPDFEPEIEQSISDTLSEINIKDFEGDFVDEYEDPDLANESYSEEVYDDEYDDNYDDEAYDDVSDGEEYYDDYDESEDIEYISDDENEDYYEDEEAYDDDSYYDEDDDELYDTYYDEIDPFDDNYESHVLKNFFKFIKNSKLKWLIIALILLIAVGITIATVKITNKLKTNNSVDYQISLATEAANNGNYEDAIKYMEKAISLNPKDTSKKFILADYYFANKEDDNAIRIFWEIISEDSPSSIDAYRKIINYYIDNKDYATINDILKNCNDSNILLEFGNYMATSPEFSVPEGTYEDSITVSLNGPDAGGMVYYTLDGTNPTTESIQYTGPLELNDLGIYTICAIYINPFGIESDVIRKTYTIDISTPKAPNVLLEAGNYSIPMLIEVDVQSYCTVYYTTDGKEPSLISNMYNGPIPMPIGASNFKFRAVNMEGTWSDITDISYNLNIKSTFDADAISNCLYGYNFLIGKSVDLEGHLIGNNTTKYYFQVSSAICYNKDKTPVMLEHAGEDEEVVSSLEQAKNINVNNIDIYYLITENIADMQNNTTLTGSYYLCNIKDGKLYKANKTEDGFYQIGEEITPDMYTVVVPTENEPVDGQ